MLTRACHDLSDDATQPDQIAHGFVLGVGHPDGRQLAGSVKTRKHGGVAAIRLHPIAGLDRNQRRRHDIAAMAVADELTINAIAARSGLVAKCQRLARTPEAVAQLTDRNGIVGNLTEVFYRARASALRHRDRDPLFVNVQTNKSGMFHQARLLCMRLCAGQPA
jgi:hypothetical protein